MKRSASGCAAFDNLALHFHLSMQSGCDSVLERMGRRYTSAEFHACCEAPAAPSPTARSRPTSSSASRARLRRNLKPRCAFWRNARSRRFTFFPYSPREGRRRRICRGSSIKWSKQSEPNGRSASRLCSARTAAAALSDGSLRCFQSTRRAVGIAHGRYGFPIYIEGEQVHKNQPRRVRLIPYIRMASRAKSLSNGLPAKRQFRDSQ